MYQHTVDGSAWSCICVRALQDAEAVQGSYDLDDLDDEWKELLGQIDAAFLDVSFYTLLFVCSICPKINDP